MKLTFKKAICCIIFVVFYSVGYSKTGQIKIKFLGNCGLYLSDGKTNIYVDFPYKSGAFNYMKYNHSEIDSIRKNSIFIFTHKHPDHYSIKNMRKTLRKKKGHKYGKWNIAKLEKLSDSLGELSIKAIKTEHSLSFKHYSYLITWHGKRIYFSGDTETADTVLTFKQLDWAFVPYWIASEVNKRNTKIDTKMLGVYHLYPIMKVNNGSPQTIKVLDKQGEVIVIPY